MVVGVTCDPHGIADRGAVAVGVNLVERHFAILRRLGVQGAVRKVARTNLRSIREQRVDESAGWIVGEACLKATPIRAAGQLAVCIVFKSFLAAAGMRDRLHAALLVVLKAGVLARL